MNKDVGDKGDRGREGERESLSAPISGMSAAVPQAQDGVRAEGKKVRRSPRLNPLRGASHEAIQLGREVGKQKIGR